MTRTILITGCSSGIGLATALAFAESGDTVIATMRDPARGRALAEAAKARGLTIEIAALDVTRSERFAPFVADLFARHGRIDVLVNNAGMLPVGAFEDMDEAEIRRVMETNFFGAALLTRAVLPAMRARRGGYVIMISSLSGLAGRGGDAIYAASKFALEGLAEALRQEVARWNIHVALVEPAGFSTNLFTDAAKGVTGASGPASPYHPLIAAQQAEHARNADKGFAPDTLGRLIVDISRSDGRQLRWAADPVAERVMARLLAGDDAGRMRFLDDVADIDWWVSGADGPG